MSSFVLHAKDKSRERIRANCIAFIMQLPDYAPFEITIERYSREYTHKQRRSIFGPAYSAMMEHAGLQGDEDKRQLHWFCCGEFFGWRETDFGRKPIRTTTKDEFGKKNPISTEEALRFYAFLQQRGAEVGCYIADPDPFWREKIKEAA